MLNKLTYLSLFIFLWGDIMSYEEYNDMFLKCQDTGKYHVFTFDIVKNTDAKIVITSCWRKYKSDMKELEYIFDLFNLNIYGITITTSDIIRGNEIIDFLNKHNVESFVILDDESSDLLGLEDYLVKTRDYGQTGLRKEHISEAINILNNSKKLVLNNKDIKE